MMSNILQLARKVANILGAMMFLAIFAAFLLQVSARYIFNQPLGWPDEAISILFVWMIFWGAAFMVPFDKQISFDLLQNCLPIKLRRIIGQVMVSVCVLLFVLAVPVTAEFISFSNGLDTPILEVPLGWVYVPFLFFVIASAIRMTISVYTSLIADKSEVSGGP